MRRLTSSADDFSAALDALTAWSTAEPADVQETVQTIVAQVRSQGDAALLAFTRRYDGLDVADASQLRLGPDDFEAAFERLTDEERGHLTEAHARIESFHQRQRSEPWTFQDSLGNELGQRVLPLDRVGLYVPGGRAAYPSSVLMTAVPAKVAGVEDLVMAVPTPGGARSDMVLGAARLAGVNEAFTIGGAQAVAALAYGTATVPRVDKIVGPGNAFVAAAKRLVFGQVGIDSIAGPSEILVIADGTTPVDWLALDLFSQAEHDTAAQAILISPHDSVLDAVAQAVERLLPGLERRETIEASLRERGALIKVRDLAEAAALSNRIAPEHLQLCIADPDALLPAIRHAGAVFLGAYSAEVMGDYVAGPSHVLPTFGTARFSSPLGVDDFQKRSSLIRCSPAGARALAPTAAGLADREGLGAHAAAARARAAGQNLPGS